jgi:hypothetical protein
LCKRWSLYCASRRRGEISEAREKRIKKQDERKVWKNRGNDEENYKENRQNDDKDKEKQ